MPFGSVAEFEGHFLIYIIMTNQEVIAEAYGEYWNAAKERGVDENGYIVSSINGSFPNWKETVKNIFPKLDLTFKKTTVTWEFRPKSLSRIEDNNGWIKIGHGAKPSKTEYFVYSSTGICIAMYYPEIQGFCNIGTSVKVSATHYQPIEKPKPPLF